MCQREDQLIKAMRDKGYHAELFVLTNACKQILYEDHILSYIKEGLNKGYYLRMIDHENRLGQISFTIIDDIDRTIKDCETSAQYQTSTPVRFEENSSYIDDRYLYNDLVCLDNNGLIDFCENLVTSIKEIDDGIKGPIYLEKNEYGIQLFTTGGAVRYFKKGRINLEIEGKLSKEGDLIQFNDIYSHSKDLPKIENIVSRIKSDYDHCHNIVDLKTDNYTVILDPSVFEDISRPIEALFSGRNIQKKTSVLWNKMNCRVFDSRITIRDDPGIPFLENSVPFDDEGVISNKVALVGNGYMNDILLDKESSALLGKVNNGRGFKRRALLGGRSYNAAVEPGITNLSLCGGDLNMDSIFSSSSKAVYIKSLMGTILGHHISGNVSGNIWLGFLVENGEITGRIKDAVFNINVLDVLQNNLGGLGRDIFQYRCYSSPFILLNDIQLTSK